MHISISPIPLCVHTLYRKQTIVYLAWPLIGDSIDSVMCCDIILNDIIIHCMYAIDVSQTQFFLTGGQVIQLNYTTTEMI